VAIEADWAGSVADFLRTDHAAIAGQLAHAAQLRHRQNEAQQLRAWAEQCAILAGVLASIAGAQDWHLLFEVTLPRTPRRADAVILAGDTIIALEFKIGAQRFDTAARAQVDDFALDLQDFHAGSRGLPIVPILLASDAAIPQMAQSVLPLLGVAPVIDATPAGLASVLHQAPGNQARIDPQAWQAAPYCPVPPIIEAARTLYARHSVENILDARAGAVSLAITRAAIREALDQAQAQQRHIILFVTGVPGAGKTLCGLNACFGAADDALRATFLTGNPSLVHVLREALVRDAVARGQNRRAAEQRMQGVIQSLPAFRDLYVDNQEIPPERVVVIDEAQRSWSSAHAIRKSRDRTKQLTNSEPAHLLASMGRHAEWAAMICLVGNGQEIHTGEGGLAEWGAALAASPHPWHVIAAPDCLTQTEARRRLPALAGLQTDPRLHLTVPTRQIGRPTASAWVDAVLEGNSAVARGLAAAAGGMNFWLTRDLTALRCGLRAHARGTRRAGLLASSGARRLRAVGLGVELDHMDAGAVARWFLDRWPDVRASDALELVATEFSAQGLELDVVGLCWDGDLIRRSGRAEWHVRRFVGTAWQNTAAAETVSNRINTYRVLLTRARHATVIYVPRGDPADRTRLPDVFDDVAAFFIDCGVASLAQAEAQPAEAVEVLPLFSATR
jgi:hypothetical protein